MNGSGDVRALYDAMYGSAIELAQLVGFPNDDVGFSAFDPDDRHGIGVVRESVPEVLWRAAIMALDLLTIGAGFVDPDMPASDDPPDVQIAMLLRGDGK